MGTLTIKEWKMIEATLTKARLVRAYAHWNRQGCIFIHVPKVAGTSINRALYGQTLGHFTAREVRAQFPRLSLRCLLFAMVRNPWARALSAFRFAKLGRTEAMGVRDPELYKIPEFETFERFLRDWLAPRELSNLDPVFRPQAEFIADAAGNELVDLCGRLEDMHPTIRILEERLGRPLVIPHANSTTTNADQAVYKEHYPHKWMVDLVRQKYQRDVDLLGYEF